MPTKKRADPYKNFNFLVEIDGIIQAGFSECSGLGSNVEVIEYREGADPALTVRKLPGRVSYSDITLKWGLTDSRELYNWYRDVTDGKISRKNVSIVVTDLNLNKGVRWNLANCWPSKYVGPQFNAKGTDVAIETLTITAEGLELVA